MKLTDDQLHELLNAGLGEGKVEVLAVLDDEEWVDRQTVAAECGIGPSSTYHHLKWMLRHQLVTRKVSSKAKLPSWRINKNAMDVQWAIGQLPIGTRMNAPDDDIREAAHVQYGLKAL